VGDFFVQADYDHRTGEGTLRVDSEVPGRVTVPALGIDTETGETVTAAVRPWSAEVPTLYHSELATEGERVPLRIGFRTVELADGLIKVNGTAVLFRGVNRHEWHPVTGRALDLETMRADVLLMKRHNINVVRTSHYPPHPAFLNLYSRMYADHAEVTRIGQSTTASSTRSSATPTAATSARSCTTATSSATAWSSPTARPPPA
jgi:beta-galactosidase